MDHFQGVTPEERWKNDQLNELRRQTLLLEQIAQLLNEKGKPRRGKRGDDDGKEG
jgi:hypothetical protein